MIFQRESIRSVWDEMLPLMHAHYKEIAPFHDIELNPQKDRYVALCDASVVYLFTARSHSGELIGYNSFFVSPHLHHENSLQALQDVIYISPEHRGFGAKFISWCDGYLKSSGVQIVMQCLKATHNHGPMLERQGYKLLDLVYVRRLDGK